MNMWKGQLRTAHYFLRVWGCKYSIRENNIFVKANIWGNTFFFQTYIWEKDFFDRN